MTQDPWVHHDPDIAEIRGLIHEMISGINSLVRVAGSHDHNLRPATFNDPVTASVI